MQSGNSDAAEMLRAMRSFLKENDMMAYLTMMAVRLDRIASRAEADGSLYLHCDPTASHYLKILLDAVFGPKDFQNEIIWKRRQSKSQRFTKFATYHDTFFSIQKAEALISIISLIRT